ncbi:MAG TPA: CoA transferase [Acidimicrobiales bacterium]|nr:CoA transferase [Acidimicrobiales bacterium]
MGPQAPDDLINEAWQALVGESGPGPPRLGPDTITGKPGSLPSAFRVEDTALACVAVALGMAAELARVRGHRLQGLGLDRAHVAAAVRSERYFRVGGRGAGMGFAPLSRVWRAADGWVRTHANYPWHRVALLAALGAGEDPESVAAAIGALPAEEVEGRVFSAGGVAVAVRSAEQWSRHPQGAAVAREPLIGHELAAAGPVREWDDGDGPASGVRVLDLTRVIAGPVCTRLLGALGADVLRLDPPGHPDLPSGAPADTLLGKRSALLDLADPVEREQLDQLVDSADVVVCGYRPGALDRFGLGAEDLAARRRGLVVVYLDAWGHTGPWAGRRGFDSVVQAAVGIAAGESGAGAPAPVPGTPPRPPADEQEPGALPCQLLDHGTGYLAAAAVLDGLRRQAEGRGGTHIRRLSLARTAAWLIDHPVAEGGTSEAGPRPSGITGVVHLTDGEDAIEAVAPPGSVGGVPLSWPGPPARYGSDRAEWSGG